jgi:uncharacterized Zn finger protein (UPF0148 family)
MSKYLLSGARMLQVSCPDCNIPLIQEKNNKKIFCANCLKKVEYVNNKEEAQMLEEKFTSSVTSKPILTELEAILTGKLQNLSTKIASESNLDNLDHLLDTTSKILKNLEILKIILKKID